MSQLCKASSLIKTGLCLLLFATILFLTEPASAANGFSKAEGAALLEYAHACLLARIDGTKRPAPPKFATQIQRPCFVTFFNGKRVFACFGGFTPRKGTLAEEIDENIRLALKNDGRSRRINRNNVLNAGLQLTFPTGQPERVNSYSEIDPLSEGMFIEENGNGVAFVPGEAKTAAWAFREGLRRLGAQNPQNSAVYRFRATAISTRQSL